MKKSKKIIFSVLALSLVAVSALTTAIVFAAKNLSGNGSTKVTYNATGQIYGTVTATTSTNGGTSYDAWGDAITYSGSETDGTTNTLTKNNITLTSTNSSVIYKFTFTKGVSTDTANKGYTATLTYTADGEVTNTNVKIEVSTNGVDYTENSTLTSIPALTVNDSTPKTLYIRVSIVNTLTDATFAGAFNWALVA